MTPALPFGPPAKPMLARLTRTLPAGDRYVFEPKWDGFRCLAFRTGAAVDLYSRHERPLTRYFPEVVEALQDEVEDGTVGAASLMFDTAAALRRLDRLGDLFRPVLDLPQALPV